MKNAKRPGIAWSFLLVGGLFMFEQQPVDAYLDAGSTGILVQIMIGSFAVAGFMMRVFWSNLQDGLRKLHIRKPLVNPTPDVSDIETSPDTEI